MRGAGKPNGDAVYEHVISYVDDLFFQGADPKAFMDSLGQRFILNPGVSRSQTLTWASTLTDFEYLSATIPIR
jgi:hypothetical protein